MYTILRLTYKFIRAEKKFHSINDLTKQIDRDIMKAYQLKINL